MLCCAWVCNNTFFWPRPVRLFLSVLQTPIFDLLGWLDFFHACPFRWSTVFITGSIWFQALDYAIYEARRNRIRLILCLLNNLNAFGGKDQYVRWAQEAGFNVNTSSDAFFSFDVIRGYFKNYIDVTSKPFWFNYCLVTVVFLEVCVVCNLRL